MPINEFIFFASLRKRDPQALVNEFCAKTSKIFNDIANSSRVVPVIIAVRNEEHDLPALLITIARAGVLPIVVDNRSKNDATYKIAQKMGAVTLLVDANKMGALQAGVRYVLDRWGETDILLTDADALVQKDWMHNMIKELNNRDAGKDVVVFGNSFVWHGPSKATDLLRSVIGYREARRNLSNGKRPLVRGSNIALRLQGKSEFLAHFFKRDPMLFPGVDMALYDDLAAAGVDVHGTTALNTTVLMRGDRVTSLRDFMRGRKHGNSHRMASYLQEYGDSLTTTKEWKADKPKSPSQS